MKKRNSSKTIVIFVTIVLILMTVAALTAVLRGAKIVLDADRAIDQGLSATVQALQAPGAPPSPAESPSKAPFESSSKAGSAVLTIFEPTEQSFGLYEGLTSENLWLGVARVSESALPGQPGNCIVFGHRDSAFRCLMDVKKGDKISIANGENEFIYTVESLEICKPAAAEICRGYDDAHLTLVTCYPFIYSGASPERYLVICRLDA
ncbi:MAG: class D sortase [Oscillospiraceae bacterium]